MFNSITWQQFVVAVISTLTLYYLLVVFLYYRRDIALLLTKSRMAPQPPALRSDPSENDLFIVASTLKTGLEVLIAEGRDRGWIKEELLHALGNRIQEDFKLRGTAFQPAINNHLKQLSWHTCQISIDEDDLRRLW